MMSNSIPTGRLTELATSRNIHVFDDVLPSRIKGLYVKNGSKKIILLNVENDEQERAKEIARALGSEVLYGDVDYNIFRDGVNELYEKHINRFTNKLLALIS